ncbi:MAG: FtsX-like permease family protein [Acidobacteriota bacterium]
MGASRTTPLAWLSLIHDPRRLAASAAGVAFAILLIWVELGFLNAIYDSTTLLIDSLDADLVVVSQLKNNTNPSKPLRRSELARAAAAAGVAEAVPLYLSRWGTWRGDGLAVRDKIRILGVDPDRPSLRLAGVESQRGLLRRPDTALFDRRLRDSYGGSLVAGARGEVDGRQLELVGDFALGTDLELNGTLIVSEQTFARIFYRPGRPDPLQEVDFGLLRLRQGASLEDSRRAVEALLAPHLEVLTRDDLTAKVHGYWTRNKPVGAVFGLGVMVGFLIGVVLCYQVLYTDVIDHLPQFATLIAMGYGRRHLVSLAIRRGLYMAGAATLLAAPLGLWISSLLADLTSLTFRLSLGRAGLVVLCAAAMCVLASLLAMRRALDADPAELF